MFKTERINVHMNTIKLGSHGNVKMIAHRGLSGLERENTCAAFVAAGNRSYFGIETDVRKTLDGHFVLCHDNDTARNCVDRLAPEQSTFQSLRRLQYKDIDETFDRGDLMMPTLAEYLKICKRYEKVCVLEFKGLFPAEDLAAVLDLIRGADYIEHTVFISFALENLIALRAICPGAEAQWLTGDTKPETMELLIRHRIGLDAYYPCLTEDAVRALHAHGLTVNCWTVDSAADAQRLIEMGVDMITTNILE